MKHFEKILIDEITIDITPDDVDGKITYRIVFSHKNKNGAEEIKIFRKLLNDNFIGDEEEIIEEREKKNILSAFSYENNSQIENSKVKLVREKPIFDIRAGHLVVEINNIEEDNEIVKKRIKEDSDSDYINRTEPCQECNNRYAKTHLDEQENTYGKRICTVCLAKASPTPSIVRTKNKNKCASWCGGSCDGESGPDYCGRHGCPHNIQETLEEEKENMLEPVKRNKVKVEKKKEKLKWLNQ